MNTFQANGSIEKFRTSESDKKLKSIFGDENKTLNDLAYFFEPRGLFEVIYSNITALCDLFPEKAEIFKDLSTARSEQQFLDILKKYQDNDIKGHMRIVEDENGIFFLI